VPKVSESAVGAALYDMTSQMVGEARMSWYGFFVGVGASVMPGGRVSCDVGYTYHWLNLRFKESVKYAVELFEPDSTQTTQFSLSPKGSGNLGQTGWAQVNVLLTKKWSLGAGALIHYFSSQLIETRVDQTTESASGSVESEASRKFKVRWTPISGWLRVSREF
jgi:hypothetical protein